MVGRRGFGRGADPAAGTRTTTTTGTRTCTTTDSRTTTGSRTTPGTGTPDITVTVRIIASLGIHLALQPVPAIARRVQSGIFGHLAPPAPPR